MKLYYAKTLMPRKVCALAHHLGLELDYHYVDFGAGEQRTAAFKALNPNAKAPVLVDGDLTLWESNAIMVHLARQAGSDLWPSDQRQVEVIRWFMWELTEITRHGGQLYVEYIIKSHYNLGPPDEAIVAKALKGFRRSAKVLEAHLTGRDWMVGEALTLADFAVGSMMAYRAESHLPMGEFPAVEAWGKRLDALPAWAEPYPR